MLTKRHIRHPRQMRSSLCGRYLGLATQPESLPPCGACEAIERRRVDAERATRELHRPPTCESVTTGELCPACDETLDRESAVSGRED